MRIAISVLFCMEAISEMTRFSNMEGAGVSETAVGVAFEAWAMGFRPPAHMRSGDWT